MIASADAAVYGVLLLDLLLRYHGDTRNQNQSYGMQLDTHYYHTFTHLHYTLTYFRYENERLTCCVRGWM